MTDNIPSKPVSSRYHSAVYKMPDNIPSMPVSPRHHSAGLSLAAATRRGVPQKEMPPSWNEAIRGNQGIGKFIGGYHVRFLGVLRGAPPNQWQEDSLVQNLRIILLVKRKDKPDGAGPYTTLTGVQEWWQPFYISSGTSERRKQGGGGAGHINPFSGCVVVQEQLVSFWNRLQTGPRNIEVYKKIYRSTVAPAAAAAAPVAPAAYRLAQKLSPQFGRNRGQRFGPLNLSIRNWIIKCRFWDSGARRSIEDVLGAMLGQGEGDVMARQIWNVIKPIVQRLNMLHQYWAPNWSAGVPPQDWKRSDWKYCNETTKHLAEELGVGTWRYDPLDVGKDYEEYTIHIPRAGGGGDTVPLVLPVFSSLREVNEAIGEHNPFGINLADPSIIAPWRRDEHREFYNIWREIFEAHPMQKPSVVLNNDRVAGLDPDAINLLKRTRDPHGRIGTRDRYQKLMVRCKQYIANTDPASQRTEQQQQQLYDCILMEKLENMFPWDTDKNRELMEDIPRVLAERVDAFMGDVYLSEPFNLPTIEEIFWHLLQPLLKAAAEKLPAYERRTINIPDYPPDPFVAQGTLPSLLSFDDNNRGWNQLHVLPRSPDKKTTRAVLQSVSDTSAAGGADGGGLDDDDVFYDALSAPTSGGRKYLDTKKKKRRKRRKKKRKTKRQRRGKKRRQKTKRKSKRRKKN